MTAGIPEWVVVGMLGVIGTVAWWGIRRIVAGQDAINETLTTISERLATINGRVGKMETWAEQHERQDDERQHRLDKETDSLWGQVRQLSNNKRGTA